MAPTHVSIIQMSPSRDVSRRCSQLEASYGSEAEYAPDAEVWHTVTLVVQWTSTSLNLYIVANK